MVWNLRCNSGDFVDALFDDEKTVISARDLFTFICTKLLVFSPFSAILWEGFWDIFHGILVDSSCWF